MISPTLVPSTCWYSNLRSVLTRAEWDRVRLAQYTEANYCCEICGGKGRKHPVECHEKWVYETRGGPGGEGRRVQSLAGVEALCPQCHEVRHIGLAQIRGRLKVAITHMMRVNGQTYSESASEVDLAFRAWKERSSYEWEADLSWLLKRSFSEKRLAELHLNAESERGKRSGS